MNEGDAVWYVAYGSSLLRERFMAYVAGGKWRGTAHRGCTDPTPPRDEFALVLPYERYFAYESPLRDGGGVAFLDLYTPGETSCRAYLVTYGQFLDVMAQQNGWATRQWEEQGLYRTHLRLGDDDGVPLFTTTAFRREAENPPSAAYLDAIRRGEAETDALPG